MSVYTYYNRTAAQYRPVKLQLQPHPLTFLPAPLCYLCNDSLQYQTPHTPPKSEGSSTNQLLCAQSRCCVVSPSYRYVILSDNSRPPIPVHSSTAFSYPHSTGCLHERRTGSGKWETIVMRFNVDAIRTAFVHWRQCHSFVPTLLGCKCCISIFFLFYSLFPNIIALCYAKQRFSTVVLPSTSRSAQHSLRLNTKPHIQC